MYNGFIKLQKEMVKMKILIYVVVFFIYSVLKPFVDVIVYNMFATTYGPGTNTTALYCGLCAALFAVSAFLCARWLCKLWDQRQTEKAAVVAESPAPDELPAPQPEQEPTIADPSAPALATPKLRFCKLCGAPIDPATRKCTDCRKQYFRPPVLHKKHLAIAAGVLACAAVVFLVFNLVSSLAAQKDAAQAQVDALNARITELESAIAEKERQINVYKRNESSYRGQLASKDDTIANLREKNNLMSDKIAFYDWAAVIVPDNGSRKYHKYGCSHLDLSDGYWIFNVENAKYQGYKACSHCCG